MKTILAFAGSNSSASINHELVKYTVSQVPKFRIQLLRMSEMPFPMYSSDTEKNDGYKNSLIELHEDIKKAAGLIISVNEHNGNPSAYFKNVIDWLSRVDRKFLADKKIFLMSTSQNERGGQSSLSTVKNMLPRFGADIIDTFSLPFFNTNFSLEEGEITDVDLKTEHLRTLNDFLDQL
ncbi:NADPH-dependent FMN reductase [Abyssalbus ytuae]|uniref:NAD(P)H-dependent oxidoreductase n=1 Tax=Abyssalbus ytuae TaxID=2926907 RepID=A0A9E6ZTX9_9FLAO|nr:NAD(P)H-dependent oxidoreductase [Abyssalbus ytuae]UOB17743.1 NAD(P)H-dependent oxidoreductase [Abyssalbus ytuae]